MSDDLSGFSLFELFKAEAQSHAEALTAGLLAVEEKPGDLQQFKELMRAAHSLKGAARIVDLDMIVDLAHTMEDCFVRLQEGRETISSERIDQLLEGVDVFRELADVPEAAVQSWQTSHADRCQKIVDALGQPPAAPTATTEVASSEEVADTESVTSAPPPAASADASPAPDVDAAPPAPAPEAVSAPPPTPVSSAAPDSEGTETETEARTVPVNADNLNRIMQLAGESMIEARRLQALGQSLSHLRDAQHRLYELTDRVAAREQTNDLVTIRELGNQAAAILQEHSTHLEQALWRSERTSTALYHEVIGSRMRPFREGTIAFPRMIRDLARSLGKKVSLEMIGEQVPVDRDILRKLEAPLNHILRNCVDHGIELPEQRSGAGKPETGRIVLHARHHAGMLTVLVRDDGKGIHPERLRQRIIDLKLSDAEVATRLTANELWEFLFLPGFSTAQQVSEISGRGVGLDVVRSMVQEVAGTVQVESETGRGTTFTLRLPVTLSVVRAVLVEIAGEPYAFPLSKLTRVLRVDIDEIQPVQGRQQIQLDGKSVGLVDAIEILGLPAGERHGEDVAVIVFGPDDSLCGLVVDRFCGEQDLVVRRLDPQLGKVAHISAAAVTDSGDPLLLVDVEDLFRSIQRRLGDGRLHGMTHLPSDSVRVIPRVLVVDDSITVREVERQLLSHHGYQVDVAVDGQDGWNLLRAGQYDLLITDIDMPRMNGIELIEHVRAEPRYLDLPIIIVSYKDREEDRAAGLRVGASAYLTKGSFHDDSFISTVSSLIGDGN